MVKVKIPYKWAIEKYARKLIRNIRPRSIVLYGSIARGEHGVGSDVDILVISDSLPKNFLERLRILSELNPSTAPIEAIAYTTSEFRAMVEKLHPTALSAIEDGITIYDDGFFERMKELLTTLRERLNIVRIEGGWEISPKLKESET